THLQPKHFRGTPPGAAACSALPELAIALLAVVLGEAHAPTRELIALTRVLQSARVGGLDPHPGIVALNTRSAVAGARPDMDVMSALDLFNKQAFQAQNRSQWGHRHYFR